MSPSTDDAVKPDLSQQLGLLSSIVDITRIPDRKAMEKALAAALAGHVPCDTVALVEAPFTAGEPFNAIVSLNVSSFKEAPESGWSYDAELPHFESLVGQVLTKSTSVFEISDGQYSIALPLAGSSSVASVLVLQSSVNITAYLELVEALLKIYRNYLDILHESESDKLTGLLNRRTFDGKFQQLVAQQRRSAEERVRADSKRKGGEHGNSWLGIIDIDHFKTINDEFGHIYGDEILLLLSRQMQSYFRRADLLFRFGGEEFVVLLEPSDAAGAETAFSRFRKLVSEYQFPQVGRVTISIGFAPISADSISTDVFGRADQALYYAKAHGRNKVSSYPVLIERGSLSVAPAKEDIDLF